MGLMSIIDGVCHQRYTKHFHQKKSDPNVNVHAVDENYEEEL